MANRVVSTKVSDELHSLLVSKCNEYGCTISSLLKKAILEQIAEQKTNQGEKTNSEDKKLTPEEKYQYF